MELDKNELSILLGISTRTLKLIEHDNKLKDRLIEKGYKLINKVNKGRGGKSHYIIEKLNDNKITYTDICDNVINTKNYDGFGKYFNTRRYNEKNPITKGEIGEYCETSQRTISRWDHKMIELDMLSKDGFFYICCDYESEEIPIYYETTKEDYNNYMKNSKASKRTAEIIDKYNNKEINVDEFRYQMKIIEECDKAINGRIIYKISKYQLNEDSDLFKLLEECIKDLYGTKHLKCSGKIRMLNGMC